MIFLALIVMLLFVPVAIGLGIYLIAPDWFEQHRNPIIITIGVVDFILFLLVAVLLFGIAI